MNDPKPGRCPLGSIESRAAVRTMLENKKNFEVVAKMRKSQSKSESMMSQSLDSSVIGEVTKLHC